MRRELVVALALVACTPEPSPPQRPLQGPPQGPPHAVAAPSPSAPAVPPVAPSVTPVASVEPSTPPDPCAGVPEDMGCVPAGPFTRGMDDDPHRCIQSGQPQKLAPASVPAARIELATFFIDKTEVTFAAYRACVQSQGCHDVRPLYYDFDAPDQPMTGVSFHDAKEFCEKQGKRLPTEAEWEKAARGPDGEAGSFGNTEVSCENAVVMDDRGRSCGVQKRGGDADVGKVAPVKSHEPGRYGLYDMMGNAEEWVADWWTKSYADCGADCAGDNPKGPCGGADPCPNHSWKVVRGGSWYWPAEHANGYHRRRHFPANVMPAYHHFGFRCAKDPT